MQKNVRLAQKLWLITSLVILPLAFFPPFGAAFVKTWLWVFFTAGYLVLLGLEILISGELVLTFSRFNLPLFLLTVLVVLSGVTQTRNPDLTFFTPGTAALYLCAFVFFITAGHRLKNMTSEILWAFSASAMVLAIITIFSEFSLLAKLTFLPDHIRLFDFNYLGGNLALLTFLIPVIILLAVSLEHAGSVYRQLYYYLAIFIITTGVFANLYSLLPGKKNALQIPPLATSWNIAVDSFQASPLLGVGSANYLLASNRYRPLSYNYTKYWAVRFSTATNYPLTLMTETGILALGVFGYLLVTFFKSLKNRALTAQSVLALFACIALFLTNLTPVLFLLLLLGLAETAGHKSIKLTDGSPVPLFVTAIPLFALVFFVFSFAGRNILAEYQFSQAVIAGTEGRGVVAYEKGNLAVAKNGSVDRYHIYLSQVNISLAGAIINSARNKQLSETDRQTVTQLVDQAINEAKIAVSLNPQKAGNWNNLAGIYKAVAPIAQGADEFAIQSTNQAIALDPMDPQLRVSLGGLYFGMKDYESAIDAFKTAVLAKPDFANAHYNLAIAYHESGNLQKAVLEMKNVLTLVNKDSKDYATAQAELTALEEKLPKPSPYPETETLTAPEVIQKEVNPPVELSEEAQPPIPAETLESAPEATPTPTP